MVLSTILPRKLLAVFRYCGRDQAETIIWAATPVGVQRREASRTRFHLPSRTNGDAMSPHRALALAAFVWLIATLGGFLGRGERGPSLKTIWREWQCFVDYVLGSQLVRHPAAASFAPGETAQVTTKSRLVKVRSSSRVTNFTGAKRVPLPSAS